MPSDAVTATPEIGNSFGCRRHEESRTLYSCSSDAPAVHADGHRNRRSASNGPDDGPHELPFSRHSNPTNSTSLQIVFNASLVPFAIPTIVCIRSCIQIISILSRLQLESEHVIERAHRVYKYKQEPDGPYRVYEMKLPQIPRIVTSGHGGKLAPQAASPNGMHLPGHAACPSQGATVADRGRGTSWKAPPHTRPRGPPAPTSLSPQMTSF